MWCAVWCDVVMVVVVMVWWLGVAGGLMSGGVVAVSKSTLSTLNTLFPMYVHQLVCGGGGGGGW